MLLQEYSYSLPHTGEGGLLMKDIPSTLSNTQQQRHQDSSSNSVVSEEDESSLDGERSSEPAEDDVDEEDVGLELLVDRRLLEKDFIVNNYSIALMYFKKVCTLIHSHYIHVHVFTYK